MVTMRPCARASIMISSYLAAARATLTMLSYSRGRANVSACRHSLDTGYLGP